MNFDVRWVLAGGNWQVQAYKTAPNDSTFHREWVNYHDRTIALYTSGLRPYNAANEAGVSGPDFLANPHEFGHTMANPDEYLKASPYLGDAKSTMNIGHELRARHLQLLLQGLNCTMPGTTFRAWIQ